MNIAGVNDQPLPEPRRYLEAQLRALLDPRSSRDTVLVTPGTPMPDIPAGLHAIETHRGLVITTRPEKAQAVDGEDEVAVGEALFGYGRVQTPDAQLVVQALDADDVPVAEIVTTQAELPQAWHAALACCPTGGRARINTRALAGLERLGLLVKEIA